MQKGFPQHGYLENFSLTIVLLCIKDKALVIKTDIIEVAYNTQVATDAKNCLLVHYLVTNENDRKALHDTALSAKENIGLAREDKITALADKGYFNAEQLHACKQDNVITYVPQQDNQQHMGIPAPGSRGEDFIYHPKSDTYTCPESHTLCSNGHWYKKVYVRNEKAKVTTASNITKPMLAFSVPAFTCAL